MADEEEKARRELCEIGHRLWQRGLIAANDGNISVRLPENRLLCTPSGVSKGFLNTDALVLTDLAGKPLLAAEKPSSELKMHVEIYRQRDDVKAVVHAHPPHATTFAILNQDLPRYIIPEMEVLLGPVALIPYHTPGTREFADAFAPHMSNCDVFLLSNHGATTVGRSITEAWYRMESLDQSCKILLMALQSGEPKPIPAELRTALDKQRQLYLDK